MNKKMIIKTGLPLNNKIDIKQSNAPIINKLGKSKPAFFIPIFEIIVEVNKEKNNSPPLIIQKITATMVVVSMLNNFEKFLTEIKYEKSTK